MLEEFITQRLENIIHAHKEDVILYSYYYVYYSGIKNNGLISYIKYALFIITEIELAAYELTVYATNQVISEDVF